ncbi:MAG: hypothetical protein EPO26_03460 [Chloroflexota bacterium]|nr:MAG: hypothetical protein EPO26_03460 [Chloroflexota bacterium]
MSGRHTTYYEVRDALAAPGCVICRLATRSARRFLESVAFECVNDLDLRVRLRDARGFCNRHAWMLLDDAREPFGAGIIYRDVIRSTIRAASSDSDTGNGRGGCIACEFHDGAIRRYISVLVEHGAEPGLAAAVESGAGLCLPHARVAIGTGGRGLAALMRAMLTVAESTRDPSWRPLLQKPNGETSRVRAGRSAARPAPDEETGDPLIALIVGARPSRWSVADERMGATLCAVCRDGDARVDKAVSVPESTLEPGEASCVHHAWLVHDRVGPVRSRAMFGSIGAALRSALVDAHRALTVAAPLTLGPLTFATRRSRQACLEIARSLPGEPMCGFCRVRDSTIESTQGDPFCRRHALQIGVDPSASIAWWSTIADGLDEYIRKNDYRFRDEARGAEQRAPWLAISAMASSRGRWRLLDFHAAATQGRRR